MYPKRFPIVGWKNIPVPSYSFYNMSYTMGQYIYILVTDHISNVYILIYPITLFVCFGKSKTHTQRNKDCSSVSIP